MNFLEPNKMNLRRGDYVVVSLPYPENATIDEIADAYTHAGRVRRVYHSERGILRVEVEGLESRTGRDWTWQDRIVAVDKKPSIFDAAEDYIEVSVFDIKTASQRYNVRNFRGDVTEIGANEYEIYSAESGNSYVAKIEKNDSYNYRTSCTCADFTYRERVCKHIASVFSNQKQTVAALPKAA